MGFVQMPKHGTDRHAGTGATLCKALPPKVFAVKVEPGEGAVLVAITCYGADFSYVPVIALTDDPNFVVTHEIVKIKIGIYRNPVVWSCDVSRLRMAFYKVTDPIGNRNWVNIATIGNFVQLAVGMNAARPDDVAIVLAEAKPLPAFRQIGRAISYLS